MRWLLRSMLIGAALIAVAGLVRHQWLHQGKAAMAVGAAAGDAVVNEKVETPSELSTTEDVDRPLQLAALQQQGQQGGSSDSDDLQNPITRALGQLLDSEGEELEELDADRDFLMDTLREADKLIEDAKESNKKALREANRQVRRRGSHSPNVVLIDVDGLKTADVGCYVGQPNRTPRLNQLAEQGTRMTRFGGGAANRQWSLLTGRQGNGSSLTSARGTLSHVLWQAGYATAMVGDLTGWGVNLADHDFDEWFGLTETSQAQHAFPEFVWYNGRHVPVPANDAGKRGAWSQQLFASEAVGYFNRHARGRPFCLCLSLSVEKGLSDPAADHQQRVAAVDALVGRTIDRLDQMRLGTNTLFMVLGADDSAEFEPAIVRWPGRVTPGSVCERSAGHADVLPTLVEAVGAWYKPRSLEGESMVSAWRSSVNVGQL